jgi:hypothetical protein
LTWFASDNASLRGDRSISTAPSIWSVRVSEAATASAPPFIAAMALCSSSMPTLIFCAMSDSAIRGRLVTFGADGSVGTLGAACLSREARSMSDTTIRGRLGAVDVAQRCWA